MRTVRNAVAAGWRLFMAIYLLTLLLEWAFGWAGLGIALAFILGHHLRDFARPNWAILLRIENWHLSDDARDQTVDADEAGRGA